MPKTNAEYCRDYRKKKRENKIKKTAKSSTERVREFRARRKVLLNVENDSSITLNDDFTVQNSESDHNDIPMDISNVQGDAIIENDIVNNDLCQYSAVEPQLCVSASQSPHSFEPDENSAYFHFFRGIHNDYQELPAKKQRLFRRECLAFLHRLLDEEDPQGQRDALNLSHSADTDDEREYKPLILDKEEFDGGSDTTHPNNILPH